MKAKYYFAASALALAVLPAPALAQHMGHDAMPADMTMLVEYKPFESAFYHTDIVDWGMSYIYAKKAAPRAKVVFTAAL